MLRAGVTKREVQAADLPAWLATCYEGGEPPVLLIHSRRDGYVPPDELIALAGWLPVRHLLVDAEGHSASHQDPAFWAAVLPFLEEALQPV